MEGTYIISDELTINFLHLKELDSNLPIKNEMYRLDFELIFSKFEITDPYFIELWEVDSFFSERTQRSDQVTSLRFNEYNNHYIYLTKGDISTELISNTIKYLVDEIAKCYTHPFISKDLEEEFIDQKRKKEPYNERTLFHLRNFSIKVDSFIKFDGEFLENYAYQVMNDYMQRGDVKLELTAIKNASLGKKIRNRELDKIQLIQANLSLPDSIEVSHIISLFFISEPILFEVMDELLNPVVSQEIFKLKKFIVGNRINQESIMDWLETIIPFLTEAIPPALFKDRLQTFFEVDPII